MAITIDGSGSITGLNAGGLPADSITEALIADASVDEARLKISNSPTNGQLLTAQSGNTGGLTWADAAGGGGKVVSWSSAVLQGATSLGDSQNSWTAITGLSANITPSDSNNKIIIQVNFGMVGTDINKAIMFAFFKAGSIISGGISGAGSSVQGSGGQYSNGPSYFYMGGLQYIDTAGSSGSAITYDIRFNTGGNALTSKINTRLASDSHQAISSIILLELEP